VTTNGIIALVGFVIAIAATVVAVRSQGSRRYTAALVTVLALGAIGFVALEGMGVFCDAPPGAACM
jgi:hypothetical protein